jgi:hypothetical protein
MADRPARTKPALHIAASLKVVAKHRNVPSVSVDEARDAIKRISHDGDTDPGARADALLREHLERSTGMSIGELASLTDLWPEGGI